jgi:hypothetical protein
VWVALDPDLPDAERRAVEAFLSSVRRAVGAETVWDASPPAASAPPATADLVVWCSGSASEVPVGSLAAMARKALLVVVRNPEHLLRPGAGCDTVRLAPSLWSAGRVRDHAFLATPAAVRMAVAAWRRSAVAGVFHAPAPALIRRASPLHAFVVDTTPRTPQARRHLRTVAGRPEKGRPDV